MGNLSIFVDFWQDDSTYLAGDNIKVSKVGVHSPTTWRAAVVTAIGNYCTTNGLGTPDHIWMFNDGEIVPTSRITGLASVATSGQYSDLLGLPVAPASYQTIVTQTGTAAPTVSGGFTPVNTYSGTPTLTWARTSAGVYTLTASAAIFSTSGKTGIFIAPLTNLNASIRGVVTSSTVITLTTAVQSVAVLGLLGLTTTNTDALLSNTMIYIQTYS